MEGSVNPCPPEWLDKDVNALLRGDAIGDTAYTHRWILKCLFSITQALPKYMAEIKNESLIINVDKNAHQADEDSENDSVDDKQIMELDDVVEDAACQLWDMTVEKAVTHHLLGLEELDIFELVSLIIEQSCAPRLTEVMIGVLANMCCQKECCQKILDKSDDNKFLLSLLNLLGQCSDVPTICEILRLLKLLMWHRINRTPKSSWAACPLLKLLCQEQGQTVFAYLLSNSLSNVLLSNLLEFLSSFLFICLPETGLNVASLFSCLVTGLMGILKSKSKHIAANVEEEQGKIILYSIMCLCSFIETPGAIIIVEEVKKTNSHFESILIKYLELEGRVDCLEDLVGNAAERLCYVISLCQLIIPYMKVPTTLMTVGRLLSLMHGQMHQYSVSRLTSKEEMRPPSRNEDVEHINFAYDVTDTLRRRSAEGGIVDDDKEMIMEKVETRKTTRQFSNPPVEECGWVSPPVGVVSTPVKLSINTDNGIVESSTDVAPKDVEHVKSTILSSLYTSCPSYSNPSRQVCKSNSLESNSSEENISPELAELKENLKDYCYQLLAWWWSSAPDRKAKHIAQKDILDVLDECHAHEVHFILKAVRSRDPNLVPRLQEQLLDSGLHQRLVAILAHMYQ